MAKNTVLIAVIVLLGLSFQSCYTIDDNRRVLVKGKLVDNTGKPVEGISVESRGSGTVLGFAASQENGDFSFTSLESNAEDFSIYINPEPEQDMLYTSIIYTNIANFSESPIANNRRDQDLYDLGSVTLRENAFLTIDLNRSSTVSDTLYFTLETISASCQNYFSEEKINAERSRCFDTIARSGSLLPEDETLLLDAKTLLNSTAVFSYSRNSGAFQRVTISIDQYNTRYDFDF